MSYRCKLALKVGAGLPDLRVAILIERFSVVARFWTPVSAAGSSTAWMVRRDSIALGAGARAGEHRPASATGSGWHATGPPAAE
jgi:hypothetical protein